MTPGLSNQRTLLPRGFKAAGMNSGVRRYRPDLGVLISEVPAVGVAVYTKNQMKAAPIHYCQSVLPTSKLRAIVTNSGQANACTGERGVEDNLSMVQAVAKELGVESNQVASASTGVIGEPMQIEKITASVPELVKWQSDTAESFALAIMTTDLIPKSVTTEVELSSGKVRITGVSKGSGMIHPNMATMLGYITTDASISEELAQSLLRETTDTSFNMISVDGETSTNDCVFFMANGASEVSVKSESDIKIFKAAMSEVSVFLAKAIAKDGEGATKLIEVRLKGLADRSLMVKAARSLTVSPLVKTAVHGADPNWGRVVSRLGMEGISSQEIMKGRLSIQNLCIFDSGNYLRENETAITEKMKADTILLEFEFQSDGGNEEVIAWGCDYSKKYIEINGDYRS